MCIRTTTKIEMVSGYGVMNLHLFFGSTYLYNIAIANFLPVTRTRYLVKECHANSQQKEKRI